MRSSGPALATAWRCAGFAAAGRYLGIGIANLVSVLTPDKVVIGGGIGAALDLLIEPIWSELRGRVHFTSLDQVEIVTADLGVWAGAIGAAIHGASEQATTAARRNAGTQALRAQPAPKAPGEGNRLAPGHRREGALDVVEQPDRGRG